MSATQSNVTRSSGDPHHVVYRTGQDDDMDTLSSMSLDSANERAYGTFEVSVIDVESESEQQPLLLRAASRVWDKPGSLRLSLVNALYVPLHPLTYKIMLFHVASVLFAMATTMWTVPFQAVKFLAAGLPCCCHRGLQVIDTNLLHGMLETESALFNFVAPPMERVIVYSSSTSFHDGGGSYGCHALSYFGGAKLVCSATLGAVSALFYGWSLYAAFDVSAITTDTDTLLHVLYALVYVYSAAWFMKTCAIFARHLTVFFCAEYLLYVPY